MTEDRKHNEGVTIVGGRPMHRAVRVSDLPVGLEQALTIAGLNHSFREELKSDPVKAAARLGLELDPVEVELISSVSPAKLADMARRMLPPKDGSRRKFVRTMAASVVAMVAGNAFLLCSGCTGADSWEPDGGWPRQDIPPKLPDARQQMATLGNHICHTYVPGKVLAAPDTPAPLLVALHDDGEMCISNVQRWRAAADNYGFSILSVNWTEEPTDLDDLDKLATDLNAVAHDFAQLYPVDPAKRYLASRGASSPVIFKAGIQLEGPWAAVVLLGGVPMETCTYGLEVERPFALVDTPPPLYYVVGQQDENFAAMNACAEMLSFYGLELKMEWLAGTTDTAQLSFSGIWEWMAGYRAGGRSA